ncbi:hypothetical protein C0989_008889 [Termitomyces sp. Mn162]|nr:hypothetical protein C0989_008889 [Termitomyces sp. Mn162]
MKEGEEEMEDVEIREKTPLAMIAEVEPATSNMEVKGKEEFKARAVDADEDKNKDEGKDEEKV